jgi:small subunit ribosomal protein S29
LNADSHLVSPVASEWINSSSPYRYSPSTSTFHQPALASKLLGQLLSVNADALSSVTLPKTVKLEDGREVSQGTNLAEVAKMGRNEDVAVGVLDAVIGALAQQSE